MTILGLRAKYFLLAAAAAKWRRLPYGPAVILVFIDVVKIAVSASLGAVFTVLTIMMICSAKTAPKIAHCEPRQATNRVL